MSFEAFFVGGSALVALTYLVVDVYLYFFGGEK